MSLVNKSSCVLRIFDVFGVGFDSLSAKFQVLIGETRYPAIEYKDSGLGVSVFEIPGKGLLKVLVLNESQECCASVQIKLKALPSSSRIYLPLSTDKSLDSIQNFPVNSQTPLILISVQRKKSPNLALVYNEKLRKFQENSEKQESSLKKTCALLESEVKNKEELQLKLEHTQRSLQEFLHKSENREISMLSLLEKKDKELQQSFQNFHRLKSKYKSLKTQKHLFSDKPNPVLHPSTSALIKELQSEIEFFKGKVETLQNNELKLKYQLNEIGQEWLESTKALSCSKDTDKENSLNTEKFLALELKAAHLEIREKQSTLTQKISKLQSEKQDLNTKLFEFETLNKPSPKPPLSKILCESNTNT